MKNQKRAYGYALLAVFFWSTVASAFKITLEYLNFIELLLYSSFVSSLIFFLILIWQKKFHLLKTMTRKDIYQSILLGSLNPFLYYLILFKAYSLLPAQQAQPLNLIWGIVIVILSIPILKQPVKARNYLAILISFIGVILISTEGNLSYLEIKNPFGVSLALGSSIIWSFYWLINAKDKQDPLVRLFLNFIFGFILTLIYATLFSELRIPPYQGILGASYTGIFEMGITFLFWLKALKLSETTAKVSILIYIMPFISLIFIHIFVGETILLSSITGLILIVIGIIIQQTESLSNFKKKKKNNLD